jgi:hypothetical protein
MLAWACLQEHSAQGVVGPYADDMPHSKKPVIKIATVRIVAVLKKLRAHELQ